VARHLHLQHNSPNGGGGTVEGGGGRGASGGIGSK